MTDIEKVQLKIGSVISATFTDVQIQAFLDMEGSVNMAAAAAIESWAAASISGMEAEKIGDYSYSKKEISNALAIASRLRTTESETPVFEWSEPDFTEGSGITAEED